MQIATVSLLCAVVGAAPGCALAAQTASQAGPTAASPSPAASGAIVTLNKVCLPLLRGGKLDRAARDAGFRDRSGEWVLAIGGKGEIALSPPDAANPRLCSATITAPAQAEPQLRQAISGWAQSQSPALAPAQVNATVAGPSHQWVTSSWSARTASGVENVVLSEQQAGQAATSGDGMSQSNLLVSLTPS